MYPKYDSDFRDCNDPSHPPPTIAPPSPHKKNSCVAVQKRCQKEQQQKQVSYTL